MHLFKSLPLMGLLLAPVTVLAQVQPQQPPAAPAPCVETMPGMSMCPGPAVSPQGGTGTTHDSMPNSMPNTMPNTMPETMTKNMPGMQAMMDNMHPRSLIQEILHHAASGTSAEPNSTPTPMLMRMHGPWMLMLHGNAFLNDLQQTSPRGGDKFFSTNWLMPMAMRTLGPGQLTLRAMFSLEPATITGRQYPLLFQQGETAFGKPITDGQHPHDFFMELAALYDWKLGPRTLLSFYAAPMGDPAIGPTAYPHRASAAENPVGSLGHHQEDSTHIADDVLTVGLTRRLARVEVSGFHGREPDENRWNIDAGAIDSWSTRLTLQPTQNLSGQLSYARIASPEALFPSENQGRTTASVMYNQPFHEGNWSSTLLWGRTRSLSDDSKENSYLLESTVRFHTGNYAWTRMENAGRSNELLNGYAPLPAGFVEAPIGHVKAYTFGYDHDLDLLLHLLPHLRSALGAQVTTYGVADALKPIYGTDPIGISVFVRFRPFSGDQR